MISGVVRRTMFTLPVPKKLEEVARLPLLKTLSPPELRNVWLAQFESNPRVIAGVMAAEEFETCSANLRACPLFVVPVRRCDGAQFSLVSQRQSDNIILFTYLESFRQNPATAPPYLVLAVYDELLKDKRAALLRADVVAPDLSRELTAKIVKWTREFYTDPCKFNFVKNFNLTPRDFDWDHFVRAHPPLSE
jgi:ATP synthase F1 complex assembly factor 1